LGTLEEEKMIEVFFSISLLLIIYFMTTLGLVQGFVPGGYRLVKEKGGQTHQEINFGKILAVSFIIASVFSGMMLYFFIFPDYKFLQ